MAYSKNSNAPYINVPAIKIWKANHIPTTPVASLKGTWDNPAGMEDLGTNLIDSVWNCVVSKQALFEMTREFHRMAFNQKHISNSQSSEKGLIV